MKKLIDTANDGIDNLIGERVTVYCANYIYTGMLEGIDEACLKLTAASIVYETGSHSEKAWKLAEVLPNAVYVMRSAVEMVTVWK